MDHISKRCLSDICMAVSIDCPPPFLITREEQQWTLLTESVQSSALWLSSSGIHFRGPPPRNVPNVFRHPGRRERLCIQHEAWQKCQLQSQTCPNQFCFRYELCIRYRVGRKQFHGQMAARTAEFYFWSKSLLCFLLSLSRALSKAKVFTQYERQTPIFFASKSEECAASCKTASEHKQCEESQPLWRPRHK